jgi:hypothetical protein
LQCFGSALDPLSICLLDPDLGGVKLAKTEGKKRSQMTENSS